MRSRCGTNIDVEPVAVTDSPAKVEFCVARRWSAPATASPCRCRLRRDDDWSRARQDLSIRWPTPIVHRRPRTTSYKVTCRCRHRRATQTDLGGVVRDRYWSSPMLVPAARSHSREAKRSILPNCNTCRPTSPPSADDLTRQSPRSRSGHSMIGRGPDNFRRTIVSIADSTREEVSVVLFIHGRPTRRVS